MQAAYDTLSTPDKRQKYDNERLKRGSLWQKRPPSAARASTNVPPTSNTTRNPFQARQPPKAAPGPSRYADFAHTSRDSSPFHRSDVNAKFQAFKAFENMKGANQPASPQKGSPPKSRPAPTAQKARTRSDWDEGSFDEPPRPSRTQSTRTPRRTGFNPYSEDGDDTSSRNTSAYYNVSRGERPQASYPKPQENLFAQAYANKRTSFSPNNNDNAEDVYSSDRISTPYTSKSGEKTYFSSAGLGRSASTASNLHNLNPERAKGSQGSANGRHRSASPRARSPQPKPRHDSSTSASSSEDEFQTDQRKESQQSYYARRGSADPRSAGPRGKLDDDEPLSTTPRRQQTDPDLFADGQLPRTHYPPASSGQSSESIAQQRMRQNLERDGKGPPKASESGARGFNEALNHNDKKPALYEHVSFPSALNSRFSFQPDQAKANLAGRPSVRKASHVWPYWAIPSSVAPRTGATDSEPWASGSTAPPVIRVTQCDLQNANDTCENSTFSVPSSSSGSASPSKNPSTENVNTQFSNSGWPGKFTTGTDSIGSQTEPSARVQRSRASPPKRPAMARSMHTSPRTTSPRQDQPGTEAPPTVPAAGSGLYQHTSPTRFSSDEWNKHFKEGQWAMPPPPPPSAGRPISTPRSRSGKRAAQPGVRSGTGASKNPFIVVDDTGDEGDDEGRASSSNLDTDPEMSRQASTNAMEIDSTTPPATRVTSENSAGPVPLGSNATSPTPPYTTFPRPPPPSTAFNMTPLTSTFPMSGSSAAGLADLKSDLGSTLPFQSGTSPAVNAPPKAQELELPHPPKLPLPPGRLTLTSYAVYMNQVTVYMREFHAFNAQIVAHFDARQAAMESMMRETSAKVEKGFLPMLNGVGGGGFGSVGMGGIGGANVAQIAAWSWMGARADDGYQKYVAWMEEDERVRKHWEIAYDKHKLALEKLGSVRKEMEILAARGGLA